MPETRYTAYFNAGRPFFLPVCIVTPRFVWAIEMPIATVHEMVRKIRKLVVFARQKTVTTEDG